MAEAPVVENVARHAKKICGVRSVSDLDSESGVGDRETLFGK